MNNAYAKQVRVMINRDLIRTKIVQLTYAYYQNGNKNMDTAEKELLLSLSKAYDLYNFLLDLIVAVTQEEHTRLETLTQRAKLTGEDIPSNKFAFNKFAVQLEENKMLNSFNEDKKLSWRDNIEFVRKLCNQIEQSETFKEYMASPMDDYEEDREVWRKLYKQLIEENDDLDALLEEKSLYWNDDKDVVDTFVLKTIKRFDPKEKGNQELLPEYKDEDDREFGRKLFRATILNGADYQHYMSEASHNWDFSRLAYMDIVIMQIAIAEMLTFQNIPVQVTINEYVELAKMYSTPKSGAYINGMLDTIARHLIANGKMTKEMPPRPERKQDDQRRNHNNYGNHNTQRRNYNAQRGGNYGRQAYEFGGQTRFVHRPRISDEQPQDMPQPEGDDQQLTQQTEQQN